MDMMMLGARLVLAVVFAIAGVAKVLDLPGSRQAMRDFGVPRRMTGLASIALPVAELTIAIGLIPRATAWWAGTGALGLLAVFAGGIAVNLARGRAPECHCFGQLHSTPAGPMTLARNGLLAAVAAFVVIQGPDKPGPSVFGWTGDLSTGDQIVTAVLIAQSIAIGFGWWLTFHLLSQSGRLLNRMDALESTIAEAVPANPVHGLAIGTIAPDFALEGLDGEMVALDGLRALGKPVLAIFTDPHCGPCSTLMPDIARWQRDLADELTIAVIAGGTAGENRAKIGNLPIERLLLDPDRVTGVQYGSIGTPAAVLIAPDGTIAAPLLAGAEDIRQKLPPAPVTPLPTVGSPAPQVVLPDLEGTSRGLADFDGRERVLVFWNPECGFCRRMLPNLRTLLRTRPDSEPVVILVSDGTAEANRALDLGTPILLDTGFGTGRAFGARGTPAAIGIDAHGAISSNVVAGAPAILEMLGVSTAAVDLAP